MASVSDADLRVYNAIIDFVKDLNANFGKRYKPVALYNRLLEKTTLQDVASIRRHVDAFKSFFSRNSTYVVDSHIGENSATILYSDHVFLNIRSILNRTDHTSHACIRTHLLAIYSLLNAGTAAGKVAVEQMDKLLADSAGSTVTAGNGGSAAAAASGGSGALVPSLIPDIDMPDTAESKFISDSIQEMAEQFQSIQSGGGNPMEMMAGMMRGGNVSKFMSNLQEKFQAGELNMSSLLSTTQSLISKITPEGKEGDQMRSVVNMTKPLIEKMTSTVNTGAEPDESTVGEIKEMANKMMGEMGNATGTGSGMIESLISGMTDAAENGGNPADMVTNIMETMMTNSLMGDGGSGDGQDTAPQKLPDLPVKASANPLVGMFNSFVMSNLQGGDDETPGGPDELD